MQAKGYRGYTIVSDCRSSGSEGFMGDVIKTGRGDAMKVLAEFKQTEYSAVF